MSATKYNYCLRHPSVNGGTKVILWVLDESCRYINSCEGYRTSNGIIKIYPKYYGEPFEADIRSLKKIHEVKTNFEFQAEDIIKDIESGYLHVGDPEAAINAVRRNCRELAEKAEQKSEYELIREKEKSPDWDPWEKIREMEKALGIICEDY